MLKKRILIIIVTLIAVGAIGIGGWWFTNEYWTKKPVMAIDNLQMIETEEYAVYYPEEFVRLDDDTGTADYLWAESEISNEIRDYISMYITEADQQLSSEKCEQLSKKLSERGYQDLKSKQSTNEDVHVCSIESLLAQENITIKLKQLIYQPIDSDTRYVLTIAYDKESEHAKILQKAINSFLIR